MGARARSLAFHLWKIQSMLKNWRLVAATLCVQATIGHSTEMRDTNGANISINFIVVRMNTHPATGNEACGSRKKNKKKNIDTSSWGAGVLVVGGRRHIFIFKFMLK